MKKQTNNNLLNYYFKILPTPKPSWKRYKMLFYNNKTVLRNLEYEILKNIKLNGKILDFGGGEKTSYRSLLTQIITNGEYQSINIDPSIKPTFLIKPDQKLPIKNNTYNFIISFNTFEHIYNDIINIEYLYKLLKKNGKMILFVPWLYPIHAHPDDFSRHTPSWWIRTLKEIGFTNGTLTPLYWGPGSTAITVSGQLGPFKKIRYHLRLILDLLYSKITKTLEPYSINNALGFYIIAKK